MEDPVVYNYDKCHALRGKPEQQCKNSARFHHLELPEQSREVCKAHDDPKYRRLLFNADRTVHAIIDPALTEILDPSGSVPQLNEPVADPTMIDFEGPAPASGEEDPGPQAIEILITEHESSWDRLKQTLQQGYASRDLQQMNPLNYSSLNQKLQETQVSFGDLKIGFQEQMESMNNAKQALSGAQDRRQQCQKDLTDAQNEEKACRDALEKAQMRSAQSHQALDEATEACWTAQQGYSYLDGFGKGMRPPGQVLSGLLDFLEELVSSSSATSEL